MGSYGELYFSNCYITSRKKHPTLGPNGTSKMDINGLACSVELYLGTDILTRGNGLIPA